MADITRVPSSSSQWLALRIFALVAVVFVIVAWIYDLGVKQGQMGALKTAYEVCRKVAPYKDGEGCK